jgi:hypothetical protein
LQVKRLPAYIQFNSSSTEDLAFAQYHYSCPLAGGCDDVPDFWNRTLEAAHPNVAGSGTGEAFTVCHKMKYKLCDGRLLKGGLMFRDWDLCKSTSHSACSVRYLSGNVSGGRREQLLPCVMKSTADNPPSINNNNKHACAYASSGSPSLLPLRCFNVRQYESAYAKMAQSLWKLYSIIKTFINKLYWQIS